MGRFGLGFVALVLVMMGITVAGDMLEKRHALRIDHSFNAITSQSEVTDRVLLGLTKDVHVFALYSPGQEDRQLLGLLERYAAKSHHFTFSLENLARNPNLLTSISSDLKDAPVGNDSLIVYSKETGRTRVLTGGDFITQGYDMQSDSFYAAGLSYEKSLTEAILSVSSGRAPLLQVLTGHGELTAEDTAGMDTLLKGFHYNVVRVQLSRGDSLNPDHPLLILSPSKDVTGEELKLLDAFSRAGGSVLITFDYDVPARLPNLEAYYRGFGIVPKPGMVVAQEGAAESYYNYPAILIPYMLSSEPTAAMVDANQTMVILPGSISLEEPAQRGSDLVWQPVLRSGPAYIHQADSPLADIAQRPEDETGEFVLAALSDRAYEDGSRARSFAIGSSGLFTDSWMHANTYSGELLLNVIDYLDPGERMSLAISPKEAVRPPLRITNTLLISLLLWVPAVLVIIAALVILLPRRRL